MSDIVNLRRVRKRHQKEEAAKRAELNRAKFGRTKSERDNEVASTARTSRALDQHKLSGEDGT